MRVSESYFLFAQNNPRASFLFGRFKVFINAEGIKVLEGFLFSPHSMRLGYLAQRISMGARGWICSNFTTGITCRKDAFRLQRPTDSTVAQYSVSLRIASVRSAGKRNFQLSCESHLVPFVSACDFIFILLWTERFFVTKGSNG